MTTGATEIPETALDREARDWVVRFTGQGGAGEVDLATFKAWAAADPARKAAFARACRLWNGIGPASRLMNVDITAPSRRPNLARRAFIGGSLAASAAALATVAIAPPLRVLPSPFEVNGDFRTRT